MQPVGRENMENYVLSVERTINADRRGHLRRPVRCGQALAHRRLGHAAGVGREGSGTPDIGVTFGMEMKSVMRYSTVNRVVEFEPERRIAWQTGPDGAWGRVLAGRIWRYVLEPVDGGTRVVESWDITPDHQRFLLKLGEIYSGKTRRDMERTLARLDELVTA